MNSQQFEDRLQLNNFEELEKEFQKTKNYFENLQSNTITCDEVQMKFPAFCFYNKEIRIKFPTYKIRVINNQISYEELEKLLDGQGNFIIDTEPNVFTFTESTLKQVNSIAINCVESTLKKNIATAQKIEEKLASEQIISERCVTSWHYSIPIEVDDNGYISLRNIKEI